MAAHSSFRWISRLILVAALIGLAVAPLTAVAAPGFQAQYFNNATLSGSPVLERTDAAINFDWGTNAPAAGVNADNFSVRWTSLPSLEAGTYRFTMRVDDGGRLWVDEAQVMDHWVNQPPTTYTVDRTLAAGYHSIRMEYFDSSGGAVAQLSWQKVSSTPTFPDWRGDYFTNPTLTGTPAVQRNDTDINFHWGNGSPHPSIPADNFSVRWTRQVNVATAGTYVFTTVSDDGVRVKVDSTTVIDRWVDMAGATNTGSLALTAGTHTITVEYYEHAGGAMVQMTWALSGSDGTGTTLVVDDLDPSFTRGGNLAGFYRRSYGYRDHLLWVWNNTSTSYYWGRWTPRLPAAGTYEVQVYIPRYCFGTTSARYRIYHNGTRNDKTVSQARYYNQWVSLGSYYFNASGIGEYVFLPSGTGEPYATEPVGYDAVRFIPSGSSPGATPTPGSQPCTIMPVMGFGDFWKANAGVRACLGCPTAAEKSIWMAEEVFQGGKMFWRQDTDTIYVLYNNGTWQQYANAWHAGDPENDPSIVAPSGLYQPRRGFGKLWRSNSAVRNLLGWATMPERGFSGSVQSFTGGAMTWSPQLGIYALCNSDGRWTRK